MPTKKPDPMVAPRQIADQLGVSYYKVLNLIAAGEFPNTINVGGLGTGRKYRTPQSDVDRFIESRRLEQW